MQTYKHVTEPSCGGLGIDYIPTLSIKERQLGLIGDVITDEEVLQILVFADLKSKSHFGGREYCYSQVKLSNRGLVVWTCNPSMLIFYWGLSDQHIHTTLREAIN